MTNYPLPTKLDLDHPLRHDVTNIRVDDVLIEAATSFDQSEGWVLAYATPMQFDEHDEVLLVRREGIVTFDWSADAQTFWNYFKGAA